MLVIKLLVNEMQWRCVLHVQGKTLHLLTYLWQDMYSGGDVVVMIIILRDRNLYAVIVQRWISYTMNKLILMLCVDHVHVILWTLGVC